MFTIRSLALTAALYGCADATGCYPAYTGAGNYAEGDEVSVGLQETEDQEQDCAPPNENGCGSNGKKTVQVSVTNYYNYACREPQWCNADRTPGGTYSDTAWTKGAECDKSEPTVTNAPPAAWDGVGCPRAYSSGGDYEAGDVVSLARNSYTLVYQCVSGANSAFCGNSGYSPGEGSAWSTAWTELGSCTGTISPTQSPNFDTLQDVGGCPAEHVDGADYEEGDRVTVDGFVFACQAWPNTGYCGQPGYKPLSDSGVPDAWKMGWTITGYCSGTISPTSSPSFVALENLGGCPDEWTTKSPGDDDYEEGDRVSNNGLVFACKGWPMGGHCGQSGYEPGDPDTDYWKSAWTVAGYCNGSMGPTQSPSFDPDNSVGGCPDEWSSGEEYEEDDKVSVVVSSTPIRKVVFKCKAWPFSGHCGNFAPLEHGGDMGWTYAGSCDGSMGPTGSPTFDALTEIGGCPVEYSTSADDYEAGDQVTAIISTTPKRALVYECRSWPNTGYCNQAAYKPTGQYGSMGWELKGACTGSFAPTVSPTLYKGTCEYQKCNYATYKDPCTDGTWGCVNGKKSVTRCNYSTEDVEKWSSSTTYEDGDVVRLDLDRYKCKPHPFTGWCSIATYKPGSDLWASAWTRDGVCAPPQPTGSPTTASPSTPPTKAPTLSPTTASPTGSPTTSPTKAPSTSPTKAPSTSPTKAPTKAPSTSPTKAPTAGPTKGPTQSPMASSPSDERLKRDINPVGKSPSGIPTYTFKYRKGMDDVLGDKVDAESIYFGVMAQDLLELAPAAVVKSPVNGYYSVDYSKIDVNFVKLTGGGALKADE